MTAYELFGHWRLVRFGLLKVVDSFADGDLDFSPGRDLWSVGQTIRHIANAEEGWFRYIVEREYDDWPPAYQAHDYPTVAALKSLLNNVHQQTVDFLNAVDVSELDTVIPVPWGESVTLRWVIWHVLEHEIHHRGELSLMLGLLGKEGLDV